MNTIQITNDEGQIVNYTEEEVKRAFTNAKDATDKVESMQEQRTKFKRLVRDFFHELTWESGYDGGEATIYKDHVNTLLRDLGIDVINTTYRATVTIEVDVTDVEAADEDEARNLIEDNISVDLDWGDARISSIELTDVEPQDGY